MQEGTNGELTRRGLAAAIRLAQRLGLQHDQPVVLSKVGVHGAPVPGALRRTGAPTASERIE